MSKSAFKCVKPAQVVAKFLRNKDKSPRGLVVATKSEHGTVSIGWSYASKNDAFDKERAWAIALVRGVAGTGAMRPKALAPIVAEVKERAARYFRVDEADVIVA